ncbi:MAG: glycosyltransferase family 2 protein [Tabrizicola sp.]|uniref:glycosyltransferase family 2 protein n=1 Tax=Tabrizicola sp. TaxID=2005166 RepID=UPI0027359E40|nr:glycosyltransferase family 2 protein [Tabrizicola sp.]MDP3263905.1 glycosyltransferase family 2 protein [Tabrizicola sp.]MDP3647269.1 glycosyltransferase family 2 protein [Paracoccaceae bacterium]MDZ4068604.1 glycosyltransferase family 2 protein [Tabrizicola sp.]
MIVGLSVVKNESDIIEVMIRHNIRFLDKLIVIDNGSADATVSIIRHLIDEGCQCELRIEAGNDHSQHLILTRMVAELSAAGVDRIIFLDADEFIRADMEAFRAEMSDRKKGIKLPWMTYIPMPSDNLAEPNVLRRITHRRATEVPQTFKATVNAGLMADRLEVSKGAHKLSGTGRGAVALELSETAVLGHFPVRTAEQLIAKALIGAWSVRIRGQRRNEAHHWVRLTERFLTSRELSRSDLMNIALRYSGNRSDGTVHDPILFDIAVLPAAEPGDLLVQKIISYTDSLIAELHAARLRV